MEHLRINSCLVLGFNLKSRCKFISADEIVLVLVNVLDNLVSERVEGLDVAGLGEKI